MEEEHSFDPHFDDGFDSPDQDFADAPTHGPFGVEAVDPIVFTQGDDNPELRVDTSTLSRGHRVIKRRPKPEKRESVEHSDWLPGGVGVRVPDARDIEQPVELARMLARVILVLAPLVLLGVAVAVASVVLK